MQGRRILVIDDDRELVGLLERVLTKAGAEVFTASDGLEGLRQFHTHQPDLVLLDIMMPVMDGWQAFSVLQHFPHVPVIFLTARCDDRDLIRGLDAGAVDYVTKPFSVKILMARIQAALRRAEMSAGPKELGRYDDGELSIDLETRRVLVRGAPAKLTATEFRLLACLFQSAGQVLTYKQILDSVWGWECRDSVDYVHVYVWHLRQKLEADPGNPRYLRTDHGVGYRFERQPPLPRGQLSASLVFGRP